MSLVPLESDTTASNDAIDTKVLSLILGWKISEKGWVTPEGKRYPLSKTPKVSKDERLAFRLIDHLRGRYAGDFRLERNALCAPCMIWEARFGVHVARAESSALAICLAALEVACLFPKNKENKNPRKD